MSNENSTTRFPLIPLDNPHLPPVGEDLQACADRMNRSIEYVLRRCLYGGGGFQAEFSVNKAGDKKLMQVVAGHLWYADPTWRTRGPEATDIMVIGKCLNDADLEAQRIYAGDMGGVLLEGLRTAGWKDSEIGRIYLTTVLKTAPLDYGKASIPQLWVKSQIHLLWQEILLVRPKLVLLQGAEAVKAVLGSRMTLRQLEADGLHMEVDFTGSPARGGPEPGVQSVQFLASVSPGAVLHDRRNPHSDQKYRTHVEQRMHRQLRDLHTRYTGKDTEAEQQIQTDVVDNLDDLRDALEKMRQGVGEDKLVAWDAEWQGAHPQNPGAYLRCVQFAYREDHGVVIALTHPGGEPRFTRTVESHGEKVQTTEGATRAAMELCKQYMRGLRAAGHYFVADLEWLVPVGLDLREEYDAAPSPEEVHQNKGGIAIELMAHAWDETAVFALDEQIQAHLDIPLYFNALHDYVKQSKLEAIAMGKVHDAERHEALKTLRAARKRAAGKKPYYRDRSTGKVVSATLALREAEIAYGKAQQACQLARERSRARTAELDDGYGWMSDEVLYTYGAWDAVAELKLARLYAGRIQTDRHGNDCTKAYWISHRAALAVLEINTTGFVIDRDRVDHFAGIFTDKRDELLAQIREAFRWPDLNPRSRFEFAELLFGEQYNGYLQQYGKAKRTRPPGALTLRAVPLRTTGKYPMEWEEATAKLGNTCSPNTDKQTLGEMFYAGERLRVVRNVEGSWRIVNRDCSKEIGVLRDFRFIDQALKSLIRPPIKDSRNNVIQDEDGWNEYDSGIISMICGDGRVRTRVRQTVETGRWASFDPNLTNLSNSREKDYRRLLGKSFRGSLRTVFTAPPGWFIVEADYTGAELLMAAIMSGDRLMIEHCQRNALPEDHPNHYDIHSNLTVRAFNLDCEPTKDGLDSVGALPLRTVAKSIVFGRLYGRGVRAIATSVRQEGVYITEQEAQALADAFMDQYPELGPFLEACTQRPRIGWMCNLFGRYRRFPYTDDENKLKAFGREATNAPMQGGVADAVAIAARNLYDYRNERGMQYRVLLQIHDALMLLVPAHELEEVIRRDGGVLTTCMVDNLPLYPTDLNGKRLPDVPEGGYRFGIGIDVNRRWGEEPDPGYLIEHGVSPSLLGWEPNGPDEWQQTHGGRTTTWSISQNQFI